MSRHTTSYLFVNGRGANMKHITDINTSDIKGLAATRLKLYTGAWKFLISFLESLDVLFAKDLFRKKCRIHGSIKLKIKRIYSLHFFLNCFQSSNCF